jgi:hypothetical protein
VEFERFGNLIADGKHRIATVRICICPQPRAPAEGGGVRGAAIDVVALINDRYDPDTLSSRHGPDARFVGAQSAARPKPRTWSRTSPARRTRGHASPSA